MSDETFSDILLLKFDEDFDFDAQCVLVGPAKSTNALNAAMINHGRMQIPGHVGLRKAQHILLTQTLPNASRCRERCRSSPPLTQAAERARARTRGQSKKSMKKLMKKFKNLKKAAKSPAEKSNKRTKVRLCCGICNPNNLNLALAPHTLALWRTMTHHS